jgi:hypothetical protein
MSAIKKANGLLEDKLRRAVMKNADLSHTLCGTLRSLQSLLAWRVNLQQFFLLIQKRNQQFKLRQENAQRITEDHSHFGFLRRRTRRRNQN